MNKKEAYRIVLEDLHAYLMEQTHKDLEILDQVVFFSFALTEAVLTRVQELIEKVSNGKNEG